MQKRRAVILFADLRGSADFAATQTPERYNEVVRAFQHTGQQVIEEYRRAEGLGDERVLAGGSGDQYYLVLVGGPPYEDECHALFVTTRLTSAWCNSAVGQNLAAFANSPYGTKVELILAIGCGDVVLDQDVWTGQSSAEGLVMGEIERLCKVAGDIAPGASTLVTLDIKEAAERKALPIVFGERIHADHSVMQSAALTAPVYPVASWGE